MSLTFLLATALSFSPAEVPSQATPGEVNPPVTLAQVETVLDLCQGTQLSLSPSGRYIAAWRFRISVGDGPVVFPLDCLRSGSPCSGWAIRSTSGVEDFLWSRDDEGHLIPGDGPVRRFLPDEGGLLVDRKTVLADAPDDVGRLGLVDDGAGRWVARAEELGDRYSLIGQSSWAGRIHSALLDRESHRVVLADSTGGLVETDVTAHWAERITPAHDVSGRLYLTASGLLHRQDGSDFQPALPRLYQPRPIVDASTGALVGGFSDHSIVGLDGQAWDEGLFDDLPSGLDRIESVAFASATGSLAARLLRLDGQSEIRIRLHGGGSRRLECPAPERLQPPSRFGFRLPPLEPIIAASSLVENWGTEERPLPVKRRILSGSARGTVLFWDGGPGSTFAMGGAGSVEQRWLRLGFNVAIIDGAGSHGIELGRRLREEQLAGVLTDARDAARHVASSDLSGTPLVIQGTSFGAIAAAEMARSLADITPTTPPSLLLVSPWLAYRHPSVYSDRLEFGRGRLNIDYAARSEVATFGAISSPDGRGYADQMADWRQDYAYDGPVLAIFGATDAVSRSEDLWPSAVASFQTRVLVVPNRGHTQAEGSDAAQAGLQKWLEPF